MSRVRIELPAEATFIAAVLMGVARGAVESVRVTATEHEIVIVEVEQAPAPSAAGAGLDASAPATNVDAVPASATGVGAPPSPTPDPSPHPAVTPDGVSAPAPPVQSPSTATPDRASTVPTPGFPAEGAADAEPFVATPEGESAASRPVEPDAPAGAGSGAATIRRCAECGGEFLPPERQRGLPQKYCSQRCRNSVRNRRYRNKGTEPVVPAREKPEKPVVLPTPDPDPEPEQLRPAAGNPLAVDRKQHECEHCGARFADRKALGLHRAAIHPIRAMKPRHDPLAEPVHVVTPHVRRATA